MKNWLAFKKKHSRRNGVNSSDTILRLYSSTAGLVCVWVVFLFAFTNAHGLTKTLNDD